MASHMVRIARPLVHSPLPVEGQNIRERVFRPDFKLSELADTSCFPGQDIHVFSPKFYAEGKTARVWTAMMDREGQNIQVAVKFWREKGSPSFGEAQVVHGCTALKVHHNYVVLNRLKDLGVVKDLVVPKLYSSVIELRGGLTTKEGDALFKGKELYLLPSDSIPHPDLLSYLEKAPSGLHERPDRDTIMSAIGKLLNYVGFASKVNLAHNGFPYLEARIAYPYMNIIKNQLLVLDDLARGETFTLDDHKGGRAPDAFMRSVMPDLNEIAKRCNLGVTKLLEALFVLYDRSRRPVGVAIGDIDDLPLLSAKDLGLPEFMLFSQ